VCAWLGERGVSVLATNVRVSRQEIDIVARDGEVILIVEVRTRGAGSFQRAFESIDARKRKHLVTAATTLWTTRLSKMEGVERVRFDVAQVTFDGDEAAVEYVKGAFTA
jgi:putative endonuclease